jgi:predicted RNA-binding Zn ribbon-like protein
MADQRRAPFFVADSRGLDFLNSVATPSDGEVEWIGSGKDLIAWLLQADLVPSDAIARLRKTARTDEFDAVAAEARKLREWFRGFVNGARGKPLKPKALEELEPLNRVLMRDVRFSQVVPCEAGKQRSGLTLRTECQWRSPDALLFPIAGAMAQLVCEEDFRHVKVCEGPRCSLLFLDRTRGHARRWCSMSVCGNRAKQAAHRKRALRARR